MSQLIIDRLDNYGGFDGWWYDIDEDDKVTILEDLAELLLEFKVRCL